jgi:hypothetical protein
MRRICPDWSPDGPNHCGLNPHSLVLCGIGTPTNQQIHCEVLPKARYLLSDVTSGLCRPQMIMPLEPNLQYGIQDDIPGYHSNPPQSS